MAEGEELMPHRETKVASYACGFASEQDSQTTSLKKRSRNKGSAIQDSPDNEGNNEDGRDGGLSRKSKLRRLTCEDGS